MGGEAEGAWGDDDDLVLDGDGDEFKDAEGGDGGEGDGWAAEDEDLELPPDLDMSGPTGADSGPAADDGYFVTPVRGAPPTQHWTNNSQLAVDHVLAGNVESACRLLHDQVGVVDFAPYKEHFVAALSRASTRLCGLPSTPSLTHYPQSNWKDASPKTALRPWASS